MKKIIALISCLFILSGHVFANQSDADRLVELTIELQEQKTEILKSKDAIENLSKQIKEQKKASISKIAIKVGLIAGGIVLVGKLGKKFDALPNSTGAIADALFLKVGQILAGGTAIVSGGSIVFNAVTVHQQKKIAKELEAARIELKELEAEYEDLVIEHQLIKDSLE